MAVVLVALFGVYMLLPKGTATPGPTLTAFPSVRSTPVATTSLPTPPPTSPPTDQPSPSAGATLNPLLPPRYGEVSLEAGFVPDPNSIVLTTSGTIDVGYLGTPCIGYTDAPPDFRLRYTAVAAPLLRIYFRGEADTALVVNDPAGTWFCDDDSLVGLDPLVTFTDPAGGVYDIWVTSLSGDPIGGSLNISELEATPD